MDDRKEGIGNLKNEGVKEGGRNIRQDRIKKRNTWK